MYIKVLGIHEISLSKSFSFIYSSFGAICRVHDILGESLCQEYLYNTFSKLTNSRTHRHIVPVTKALNRDILAAEKERKKRRKEEEEEVPYMV